MSIAQAGRTALAPASDPPPLPFATAVVAIARCVIRSATLLAQRRIRQPTDHVGDVLTFADGTSAQVYRETVVPQDLVSEPTALVVEFRLRWIRGRGHAIFRAESILNTPLFVGFPGFVSKLWLTDDDHGCYRGVYEWDGPDRAHRYARALWWVLAIVSEHDSIHHEVVPGRTRAELLEGIDGDDGAWWRVTAVRS